MAGRIKVEPNPSNSIVVTKIEAARHQLEMAIKLWFDDDDPISIHTLVSAAQEIVHPFAKAAGTFEGVLDTIYAKPGYEEEWLAWMRVYQNFFKHGSKDREASIKFNPVADEGLIRTVIQVYYGVTGTTTTMMNAYIAHFIFTHPDVHKGDPYPHLVVEAKKMLAEAPKDMFLEQFFIAAGVAT